MLDPTQPWGLFWATVFGAALGVIAGTLIQYLFTWISNKQTRRRQRNALLKELAYNQSLVGELDREVQKFRNAVNGNVLNTYFGYFGFGRGIFAQANACAGNGTLYEFFSTDEIRHVQRIFSTLSASNETWVNNEITRRRNISINTPTSSNSAEAVQFVNFVDNMVQELKQWIDGLIKKLQEKA